MLSDFSCPAYPGAVPGAPGNVTSESRLDPQGKMWLSFLWALRVKPEECQVPCEDEHLWKLTSKIFKERKNYTHTHTKIKPIQKNRKGNQRRGLIAAQRSPPPNHQVFPFLSQIQGVLDEMLRMEKYGLFQQQVNMFS